MAHVLKADKSQEEFSEQKVINSIKRAGIPENIQTDVLNHVKSKLYDNIPTSEIYHHIVEFLNTSPHPYSKARYGLKDAIMALGPTGYPFEDFIAKLLESLGYHTDVRQILSGTCISHEIDVLAEKDGKKSVIEAKFHNSAGNRSDVHVALYTKARFDDVKEKNGIAQSWLVTNTKTTTDANTYAACVGMRIMSWSYPEGDSLRDHIEKMRLYPITMLTTLSQGQKETLLNNHIVLCKTVNDDHQLLEKLPLSKDEKERVTAELAFLCSTENTP